jgi:hypothetical protein
VRVLLARLEAGRRVCDKTDLCAVGGFEREAVPSGRRELVGVLEARGGDARRHTAPNEAALDHHSAAHVDCRPSEDWEGLRYARRATGRQQHRGQGCRERAGRSADEGWAARAKRTPVRLLPRVIEIAPEILERESEALASKVIRANRIVRSYLIDYVSHCEPP